MQAKEEEWRALTSSEQVVGLLRECDAMVRWALDRGLTPAPSALEAMSNADETRFRFQRHAPSAESPSADSAKVEELKNEWREAVRQAALAHGHLSTLVRPARPQTIVRIYEERKLAEGRSYRRIPIFFGPLPIVRRLVIASLVLLVVFVLLASSEGVRDSAATADKDDATPAAAESVSLVP